MIDRISAKNVASDVATVKKHALAVISIFPDGSLSLSRNPRGKLGVLAILGPGSTSEKHFDTAVLTEIGFRSTTPYCRSSGSNFQRLRKRNGKGRRSRKNAREIPARHPWFSLTAEQYHKVAPLLFSTIQLLVEERIALWETGCGSEKGINIVRESSPKMQRKGQRTFVRHRSIPLAIRVSLPKKETLLVQDVLWAELNLNQWRVGYLREFASWIVKWLRRYEQRGYRRNFRMLKGFQGVRRLLSKSSLPYHLKVEALKYLPGAEKYRFYPELVDLLEWSGNPTRAHALIESAQDPKSRVGEIQIHTVGYRKEILMAQVQKKPRSDDEIPF